MRFRPQTGRAARKSIGLLVAMLLLTVPAVALASHQFPDVPTGHPFHAEIHAIAEAGITAGFMDGGYHPSDPVTRQAMAAFMQRGFGRVGQSSNGLPITSSFNVGLGSPATPCCTAVSALTIKVPGATNPFVPLQMVYVAGRVTFYDYMDSVDGCPCEFGARVLDTTNLGSSTINYQTFYSPSPITMRYSVDVDAVFAAPPGSRTFQLEVFLNYRYSSTNAATFVLDASSTLTAMTVPFGPSGENTL